MNSQEITQGLEQVFKSMLIDMLGLRNTGLHPTGIAQVVTFTNSVLLGHQEKLLRSTIRASFPIRSLLEMVTGPAVLRTGPPGSKRVRSHKARVDDADTDKDA